MPVRHGRDPQATKPSYHKTLISDAPAHTGGAKTKDPADPNEEKVDATNNPGAGGHASRPSGQDRQAQYERTREHAASGQEEQDRERRIRRRAQEIWEQEGQPEGFAEQHWERAAQDVDREDSRGKREATEGGEPNTKSGSDRT